jgi:acyl-homoserine-lactone acylase
MTEMAGRSYEADVRWTEHGVAHIRAEDWGGLGFGHAWACARDHLPTIADQIVKVRSERALFHGPGPDDRHLASDFGYLALGVQDMAVAIQAAQPPHIREMLTGYVAGYNARLAEAVEGDLVPEWGRGAEWVRPISELDLYAFLGDMTLMGSGRNFAELVGLAVAPGPDGPADPAPLSILSGDPPGASNGWAFGRDATASGHGIVLANPHFPWDGEARFWECHLTIPGELDVYGVSLIGAPTIQMGFNADVAWAHTFSCGHRFTLNRLDLVPGRPTAYRYGDEEREMVPVEHAVRVLGPDGEPTEVARTMWSTHHGPMVNLPLLGWGLDSAFCIRDGNLDNTSVVAQFLGMDQARSMDELQQVFADVQGLPWVNTLAADRTGRAWYIDGSATPNLSAAAQERFRARLRDDFVAAMLFDIRVALLDGSEPDDEWLDDPGARVPGLIAHEHLPQLERTDFVANANDSHWLANPAEPLEGYSVLHGLERTPRSLRTRQNLRVVQALADGGDVTVGSALSALFDNAGLTAELLRETAAERCRAAGTITVDGQDVDVRDAGDVLAAWDGRAGLTSVGAALWREAMAGFSVVEQRDGGALWAVPFDADDPVATPSGAPPAPADGPDPLVAAVARAVVALGQAGVAIDAPLGDVQWAQRGEHRVPVHGGGEGEGVCNILAPIGALSGSSLEPGRPRLPAMPGRTERTGLRVGGYRVTYGTSFLMAVELTDDGPRGLGLVAYGQSGDPTSEHHLDGTQAYADQAPRPLLFTEPEIEAATLDRRSLRG